MGGQGYSRQNQVHGKHLVIAAGFPAMRKLPFPIQRLTGQEITQSEELERQPSRIYPQGDKLSCKCQFYRKYLLPCRHIFYWENRLGGGRPRVSLGKVDLYVRAGH